MNDIVKKKHIELKNHIGIYDGYLLDKECDKAIEYFEKQNNLNKAYDRLQSENSNLNFKNDKSVNLDENIDVWFSDFKPLLVNFDTALRHYQDATGILSAYGIEKFNYTHIKIQKSLLKLEDFFEGFKNKNIIGYGASGRANMLVNTLKLTTENLKCIIDESPERYNRYIANQEIPIIPLEKLSTKPDYIFILAWNFAKPIMEKTKHLKVPYIIPFPEIKIIQP